MVDIVKGIIEALAVHGWEVEEEAEVHEFQATLTSAGLTVVPMEPTEEMVNAVIAVLDEYDRLLPTSEEVLRSVVHDILLAAHAHAPENGGG